MSYARPTASPQRFQECPPTDLIDDLERLGEQIAELSAHIQAATYRLLVLIREFDARGGWNTGFRSCAHWLNWRTGLALGAAREKVRVARALEDLPLVSQAMRKGTISYSKVRALTRVATPETEADLLDFALAGTAAHVERLVRAWRRVDRIEAMEIGDRQHDQRYLSTHTDEDGMLILRGRLTPEVGAVFMKALEAASEKLYQRKIEQEISVAEEKVEVPAWSDIPAEQRRADALELLAESALEGGLDPGTAGDRYQVVVHFEASGDSSAETSTRRPTSESITGGQLKPGEYVSAETSRRLACDSSRVEMTHGADGSVLNVGRKTRVIHPALRRALKHRHGSCCFPGCDLHLCDAHHVEHWANGGKTELGNLILLCRHHHRAIHEGGLRVELDTSSEPRFFTSEGVLIAEAPAAPELADEPFVALTRSNWQEGIEIDAEDSLPGWQGEAFDLQFAIDALRDELGELSDVSAETSTGDAGGRLLHFKSAG